MPKSSRPNFLLFITDQHRADFLGCYGHPVLRTPHIDSIAARGTAFDRFYVASPVCQPNRASLMTGRMPSVHDVRSNGIPLSMNAVTFVDLLRDAGYKTALVGKSHLQNFTELDADHQAAAAARGLSRAVAGLTPGAARPSRRSEIRAGDAAATGPKPGAHVQTPFYGFDHVTLVRAHGDEPGGDYDRWLDARDPKAKNAARPEEQPAARLHGAAGLSHRDPGGALRHGVPRRARLRLSRRRRSDDAPFFLMVSFPDPHHPFNPPGKYWDMYKPEQFPVPEAFSRNDWTPPALVQNIIKEREAGKANLTGMGTIGVSAREAQEARALTCGMIACVDDAIGAVLGALDRSGQRDDTVVIFTSDHGDHLGDHRLMLKGAEQYQSIVRVPFIWSDPQARGAAASAPMRSPRPWTSARPCSSAPRSSRRAACRRKSLLPVLGGRRGARLRVHPVRPSGVKSGHRRAGAGAYPDRRPLSAERVPRHRLGRALRSAKTIPASSTISGTIRRTRKMRAAMTEKLLLTEIEHVDRVPLPTRRACFWQGVPQPSSPGRMSELRAAGVG